MIYQFSYRNPQKLLPRPPPRPLQLKPKLPQPKLPPLVVMTPVQEMQVPEVTASE